jgi:hypothetical protein
MPSKAERYVCMPETLAFQSISGVFGAGPAEKRVKEESPINCGHSYWSRLEFAEVVLAFNCALAKFEFDCKEKTAKTDEISRNAKINATLIFTCVESYPPRMND